MKLRRLSSAFAVVALATMSLYGAPSEAAEQVNPSHQTHQRVEAISSLNADSDPVDVGSILAQYVNDHNGSRTVDIQALSQDDASPILIEAANTLNRLDSERSKSRTNRSERSGLPIHGKYCGPGHSGPGDPDDTLDSLCQQHDKCYGDNGYFACSCDGQLLKAIRDNRKNFKSAGEKAAAAAIFAYFSGSPCNPFK